MSDLEKLRAIARDLRADFSRCSEEDQHHPAWGPFVATLTGKAYGPSETATAWYYYRAGWDANIVHLRLAMAGRH